MQRSLFTLISAAVFGIAAFAPRAAHAAEIKVYASVALKSSLAELVPVYEKATGNKVTLELAPVAALKKRIDAGETFDVAVLTPAVIRELGEANKIDPATNAAVARAGIGVGVRKGGKKLDISTTNAFKQTLRDAKSISYTDPALGGASGVYIGKLIQKLGLTDEMKSKTVLAKGSSGMAEGFAKGEVELGLLQISELLPMQNVEVVGPLPTEIQNYTVFSGAVSSSTKEKNACTEFLKSLASTEAAAVFKAKGLEPGA